MRDGDDYTYYDADTWITLHEDSTKFYLPIWVNETAAVGIDFRARAINCDANDGLEMEEVCANADNSNYVAVDTKKCRSIRTFIQSEYVRLFGLPVLA